MFGYSWWTLNPAAMCSYRNFGNYQLYNNLHIMSVDTDNCSSILCVQPCNLDTIFFPFSSLTNFLRRWSIFVQILLRLESFEIVHLDLEKALQLC